MFVLKRDVKLQLISLINDPMSLGSWGFLLEVENPDLLNCANLLRPRCWVRPKRVAFLIDDENLFVSVEATFHYATLVADRSEADRSRSATDLRPASDLSATRIA